MNRFASALLAIAGLMGAAGVGLAAWSAHRGGGDLAMSAALFLILHAGVVAALALAAEGVLLVAAAALGLGTILFSGELAIHAVVGAQPWPTAAPVGGMAMIGGWLWLGAIGLIRCVRAVDKRA